MFRRFITSAKIVPLCTYASKLRSYHVNINQYTGVPCIITGRKCTPYIRYKSPLQNFTQGHNMSQSSVSNGLNPHRLVWVDLEMTGLDVEKERIIEIACLVTEEDLSIVAKGPNIVIHESDEILGRMDEWNTQHHGQSGLTDAVRNSKVSTEEAETMVLDFVKQHVPQGKCPLAGNSVGTDKVFLERYMPQLAKHLHYRVVDVSTVKELCRRWYPKEFESRPPKKIAHRAMDDILESLDELKFYRSAIFKSG